MNKSHLSKSILIASVIFVVAGVTLLLWPPMPNSDGTLSLSSNTLPKQRPTPPAAGKTGSDLSQTESQATLESTTIILQQGDSLSRVLDRLGVSQRQIAQLINADKQGVFTTLRPDQRLTVTQYSPTQRLSAVTLLNASTVQHHFTFEDDEVRYQKQLAQIDTALIYREVTIQSSLFVDGSNAGIPDKVLFQLTDIFRWDIDFALDIRRGDRFALLFEERRVEGDIIGYGDIVVAQFINNGRVFDAIRSQTSQGVDYFSPDGLALRKAFIRSPVDFTRISSPFNPHRLHPIFKTTRPHQGVDYAAPTGTEVHSAGDGTVAFVGVMKGYGNTVIIDHRQGYSTLYAHLDGFAPSLTAGQTIKQDDVIAFVGQTGWATGPHLHYEFRINGRHQNPETITIPNDSPMSRAELKAFLPQAQTLMQTFQARHSNSFNQAVQRLQR